MKVTSASPLKYLGYCRKSTDEKDRQIMSIDQQIQSLKEFATRSNIEIVEFFTEAKTAKKPGRKVFNNLLKLIEKGYANGILAWHPDRLARNSIDGGKIIYLLDTGQIQDLKFPTFWFESTSQGKFMLNIAFGQSKYYVDNLSENVKRGVNYKAKNGGWPGRAPLGYKNDKNTLTVVVDELKAPFVKQVFEKFSSGEFSTMRQISEYLSKNKIRGTSGGLIYFNQIRRMLSRPFYYGLIQYGDIVSEGKHTPLITKELFDKVQVKLNESYSTKKPRKYQFAFTGLIRCKECGAGITAEKHTKHYPKTLRTADYIYYRCTKKFGLCSQPYLTEEKTDRQIRELVRSVSLNGIWEAGFRKLFKEDKLNLSKQVSSQLSELTSSLEAVEKRLDKLLESFLDEVIDQESYQLKKNQLLDKKLNLKSKIEKLKTEGSTWLEPLEKFINVSAESDKITRAKKNYAELASSAKKVGSNYLLNAKLISFSPEKPAHFLAARSLAARDFPTFSDWSG